MKIGIFYPESEANSSGNQITASRWAGFLEELGHDIELDTKYEGGSFHLAICLNVLKTADIASAIRHSCPSAVLCIAITGTDLHSNSQDQSKSIATLKKADAIIAINPASIEILPNDLREKTQLIYQSAIKADQRPPAKDQNFNVLMLSHLRPEKDPLRLIEALKLLPKELPIRVKHYGAGLDKELAEVATKETQENFRYEWLGEIPYEDALLEISAADLLVLTSKVEGAPSVLSEALVADIPIVASDIPSMKGLLGAGYPGLFQVGDSKSLAQVLQKTVENAAFYQSLRMLTAGLSPKFQPIAELRAWRDFLERFEIKMVQC